MSWGVTLVYSGFDGILPGEYKKFTKLSVTGRGLRRGSGGLLTLICDLYYCKPEVTGEPPAREKFWEEIVLQCLP